MTVHYADDRVTVHHGDCLDALRELPDCSVDAVVTDPPYGLGFMGKAWDAFGGRTMNDDTRQAQLASGAGWTAKPYGASGKPAAPAPGESRAFQAWCEAWAAECLRVLKPGGHLLAFGGSRTWHRLACAVEDAGFEIRDSIAWLYGSGFPKSLDVSKAIDRAAGAEREVVGVNPRAAQQTAKSDVTSLGAFVGTSPDLTAPATDAARAWQGWGTALKPAFEPIVVARKPLAGTVAGNVLAYGTGALNIDACRVGTNGGTFKASKPEGTSNGIYGHGINGTVEIGALAAGRWPANVLLDGSQADALDEQSGVQRDGTAVQRNGGGQRIFNQGDGLTRADDGYGGEGGASRFFPTFRYEAKAPAEQRPSAWVPACDCERGEALCPDGSLDRDTDGSRLAAGRSWNTSTSGSKPTDAESPQDTTSTTATATSSTTTLPTFNSSPSSNTSASTQGANSATANGGSRAVSATSSSLSAGPTGISAPKAGRSTDDAAPAISPSSSKRNACAVCGTPKRLERHATVKPLDLMRWLIRLVTPPGGTILDPFAGSGTTIEAALLERVKCIGIEREADYLPLIMQRIHRRIAPLDALRGANPDVDLGLFGEEESIA